jgi:two-component system sensor histidine kinase DesK
VKQLSAIAERERIGRDLHDLAGHALSSISLKAQLASKLLDKNKTAQAKEEIDQLATLSQSLLSDIRNAVSDIKSLSFLDELQKIESLLVDKNIELHKTIEKKVLSRLGPSQEANLTLIVKEALINVLRHSNATKVILQVIENNEGIFEVFIQDDGNDIQNIEESNGLIGMRERALLMGGEFTTSSENGFAIKLKFKGNI